MNIDGLRSTKDSVVVDAVADIFKVQNYHDLVRRTKAVTITIDYYYCKTVRKRAFKSLANIEGAD